jgi:hypothetical protein
MLAHQNSELVQQVGSADIVADAELLLAKLEKHVDHINGDLYATY